MNKCQSILILLSLCFSLLIFCCQKKGADWKGTIEEKGDVIVLRNPKGPIYKEPLFTLEEDLVLGEATESEEPVFLQVRDIAIDSEEHIYVLDNKAAQVKVFDKRGSFLRTIGKKGQGPGELNRPTNIQISAQDEIIIQDISLSRFTLYSLNGDFLKSISTAKLRIGPSRFDSEGNIYGVAIGVDAENRLYEVKKFNTDQEYLYTLGSSPLPNDTEWDLFFYLIRYFLRDDDCVVTGYPVDYELNVFNPEGKLIRKIVKDYDPVEITQEERDKELNEIPKRYLKWRKLLKRKYHAAYRAFGCDEKKWLYVETFERTEDGKGYYYDIFDEEGKYINKLPLNIRLWRFEKGKLYTREEDEEGYHLVKRHKVTWNIDLEQ